MSTPERPVSAALPRECHHEPRCGENHDESGQASSSHQLQHRRSSSSFFSPLRHHTRTATTPREVKETLNAHSAYGRSVDDGTTEHRINQYAIKQEIGRGSFGAVHLAVDEDGREYAIKQFSKSRLRKRIQSDVLRRSRKRALGAGAGAGVGAEAGAGANSDSSFGAGRSSSSTLSRLTNNDDPLYLIRQEIAIMKKLHHSNLVELYEVLDDPEEDSLYIVMERCRKGVAMRVGFEEHADQYDDERCRLWFRDLLLGIEYLHAHGIAHRDIKPDNCLLTDDDVLKVVDFGVSEMFEKHSEMLSDKAVGSPAFFPPELCVPHHGDVSGRAADIWSMGVTLYCLRYGRLPFEKEGILELYEAIRSDQVELDDEVGDNFRHLMARILEKDPKKRIKMAELREHPWVTKDGSDPLLSAEENTTELISMPTDQEVNDAITKDIRHVFLMVKVVNQFERMIEHHHHHRQESPARSGPAANILGGDHFTEAPESLGEGEGDDAEVSLAERPKSKSKPKPLTPELQEKHNRPSSHHKAIDDLVGAEETHRPESSDSTGTKGHARNPTEEEPIFLDLAPSSSEGVVWPATGESLQHKQTTPPSPAPPNDYFSSRPVPAAAAAAAAPETDPTAPTDEEQPTPCIISESPGAADFEIYATAYRQEIERIRQQSQQSRQLQPQRKPTVYLTRRVEDEPHTGALLHQAHQEGSVISAPSNTEASRAGKPHDDDKQPLQQLKGPPNVGVGAGHKNAGGARNTGSGKSLWRAMSGSGKLSDIMNRVRRENKGEENEQQQQQQH